MRATIRRWGNSAAIRIPAALLEMTRIGVDCEVDIHDDDGRTVIDPVHRQHDDLDRRLVTSIRTMSMPRSIRARLSDARLLDVAGPVFGRRGTSCGCFQPTGRT